LEVTDIEINLLLLISTKLFVPNRFNWHPAHLRPRPKEQKSSWPTPYMKLMAECLQDNSER
jgi:hypothetical protein